MLLLQNKTMTPGYSELKIEKVKTSNYYMERILIQLTTKNHIHGKFKKLQILTIFWPDIDNNLKLF